MLSIIQFCEKHQACEDGRAWAIAECETMVDVWDKAKPEWLLWVSTRPGVLTDKELRLFAVFCARQVEHFSVDQRSRDAIAVAEQFANGEATQEELTAARDAALDAARDAAYDAAWYAASDEARAAARAAAWDAALDAARDAAYDAAWYAASDEARAAARAAAWDAAWDAARDAAYDAAWYAASDEARAAARAAQCDWLRQNTTPNFGGEK